MSDSTDFAGLPVEPAPFPGVSGRAGSARHKLQLPRDVTPSHAAKALAWLRAWCGQPRTKLGLTGLFLVWWGFSLRHDASYGFARWYLRNLKGLTISGRDEYQIINRAIQQELHELGGVVVILGIPLIWMAVWDWLRSRDHSPTI